MALVEDTNLFVGGLDKHVTEAMLVAHFSRFGAVEKATIIYDRQGVTKGYGFVQFYTYEACNSAAHEPYHYLGSKRCNVNIASLGTALKRPGAPKPPRFGLGERKRPFEGRDGAGHSPAKKIRAGQEKVQGPPTVVPASATFLAQLEKHGIVVTLDEANERLDELRASDPLEAFKYFLEVSELFKQSPKFDEMYESLLNEARKVRVVQALDVGYTDGLVKTHAHLLD